MKNIILMLSVLVVFAACKPSKVIVERYYTKDSVRVEKTEVKYRDTNITVNLPKQEITVIDTNIIVNENKPYTSNVISAETDYAKAFSQVIQGRLRLTIENKDSAKIYIKNAVKEVLTEIIEKQNETSKEVNTKIEYVNKLTFWQKVVYWFGIAFMIILFIVVIVVIKKLLK